MAQKKARNIRKRKTLEDQDEGSDGGDEEESLRKVLEDTRLLQKQRERRAGLDAAAALTAQVQQAGAMSALREGQSDLMEAYVKEESKDDLEMDPEMEKYIEAQLAKRLGRQKPSEIEDVGDAARTDEDDLYSIPENLRAQKSKQQDVSSWMTGIQEVALPMDFKLRNIEETEAAKKLLLSVAGASTARVPVDEEEEERPNQGASKGVHRAVFPRDFGRQNAKDVERRVELVIGSQRERPSWKDRKMKGRRP
ncbi:hypothetical protein WJX75_000921 [Coccomyxa subellipsoidea]|uniref:Hepatocellular carcinoma-associated antigen 59 n=1 Tax=Coccomyxa subellipsoidea TaxID=248742 RepID=A0ABR2YSJ5_9CHLO